VPVQRKGHEADSRPLTTFKMLIATLLASDMIESEVAERGKVIYSLQNSKGTRD